MQFQVINIEETDSTNHWLREHGKGDMVVVAGYQTAGRGCGTNSWESERGKNLTFSVLLHPTHVLAKDQFIISMANALALADTLDRYTDGISIKWPNDIYWNDSKLCGTLIETRLQGNHIRDCIIGTGINVNQQRFLSDAPNPVSLYQLTGHDTDLKEILETFLYELGRLFDHWSPELMRERYRQRLYRRQGLFSYRDKEGLFLAELITVSDDGTLLLLDESGKRHSYRFKEVTFIQHNEKSK